MSQYPSPYNTPGGGYAGYGGYYPQQPDSLAPARRASILMFVLGGLVLLMGTCNLISTFVTSPAEVMESQQRMMGTESPFDAQTLRIVTIGFAIVTVVQGIAMILLGTMVRRGSMAATIASIVLTSLVLLLLLLMVLATLVAATAEPLMLAFGCVFAIPAALHALLLVWLIQSIKGINLLKTAEQQYRQHYWQYQQQFAQGPSGYGAHGQPPQQPPPSSTPPEPPPTLE